MDDSPPCVPEFFVSSICDNDRLDFIQELVNTVTWEYNDLSCSQPDDLSHINVYYSEREDEALTLLTVLDIDQSFFDHQLDENIAGCYAVSAVDISGNERSLSASICVYNCPAYILPNTFTPNNDNSNDLFIPRQNRFIDRVDFKVFNRWGQKVFETSDPLINWDGTNLSEKQLAEGTYYYTCQIFEKRVAGITEGVPLNGTIQLIR